MTRQTAAAAVVAMTSLLAGAGPGTLARAEQVPASIFEMEKLTAKQLARLPDLRVLLGERLQQRALEGRNAVELRLLRNSIFAQCGFRFRTSWLRGYFMSRPWYPRKGPFKPSRLSEVDRQNFRLIKQQELGRIKRSEQVAWQAGAFASVEQLSPQEMKKLPDLRAPIGNTAIAEQSLAGKTRNELKLLRNSIYAQYGREFQTRWLQAYFASRSWYARGGFKMSRLSSTDLSNIDLIKRYEHALRRPDEGFLMKMGYCEHEKEAQDLYRMVFKPRGLLLHSQEDLSPYGADRRRQCRGQWRVVELGQIEFRSCLTRDKWLRAEPDPERHECNAE